MSKVGRVYPKSVFRYNSISAYCRVKGLTSSSKIRFWVSITKNSILSIFGLIREAVCDSATSIENIYLIHCDSGRSGVADTMADLSSDRVKCHIGPRNVFFSSSFCFYLTL